MSDKGLVLLVEDNAELNAGNARALRMLDYEVRPAPTLAEARNWLLDNQPDVILLDVMLPDGDGIDFCAEIRGAPLRTAAHILFLTAKTDHADRVRGLEFGGDDYITKPFHPEELLARIEAAMRRRSMGRALRTGATPPDEEEKLRAFAARYGLTEKEHATLERLLHSRSIREAAERLNVTVKGVEYHLTKILQKTGAGRRFDLLRLYMAWFPE